jgi:hypothetical protein
MSTDYTTTKLISATLANASITGSNTLAHAFSKTFNFKCLHLQVYMTATPTGSSNSLIIQKSDSAGSFSSPTTLGTIAFTTADTAGTTREFRVADADVNVTPGYVVRLRTSGADATIAYAYEWTVTDPSC